MKKAFLYLLSVLMFGSTLSSCLGETKSITSNNSQFAVIDVVEGVTVAKMIINGSLSYITSSDIKRYDRNDVLLLNYEINFNDYTSLNQHIIFNANYAAPVNSNVIFKSSEHARVLDSGISLAPGDNPNKFKSLAIEGYGGLASSFFNDRWLLNYQGKITKEQTMSIDVYYDKDKQYGDGGSELPANTHIIDIKLNISGTPNTGSEATDQVGRRVLNLSEFRNWSDIRPETIDDKGTGVYIIFRYFKEGDAEKPTYTLNVGMIDYYN